MAVVVIRAWAGMAWLTVLVNVVESVHPSSVGVRGRSVRGTTVATGRKNTDGSRKVSTGLTKRVPNTVVRGELGLITLRGRRDIMRLMYWWKIVNSKRGDLLRDTYEWSKSLNTNNRCRYTKKLLAELGLAEEWVNEELGTRKQWAKTVRDKVWERETEKWRKEMDTKVKLERYRAMKTELKFEPYLTCDCSRYDIANYVQFRGGVAKLRVETGRVEFEEGRQSVRVV
jgi:hypothetical protein